MSPHDIGIRAKSASNFLQKGHNVRIELLLRGRQKAQSLSSFASEKIDIFLKMVAKETPFNIERQVKKEGRGLTMTISKAKENNEKNKKINN
jgi:translation initiation factor IF-3